MKKLVIVLLAALFAVTACKKETEDTEESAATEQGAEQATEEEADEAGAEEEGEADNEANAAADEEAAGMDVVSTEILERDPVTESAQVKHILISWDEKASIYSNRGGQDERGAERTKGAANRLALELTEKASEGGENADDFDALMAEYSEDKGSAQAGRAYPVTPSAGLVQNFKDLALRLEVGEVGIVESIFGYHIMKRTE